MSYSMRSIVDIRRRAIEQAMGQEAIRIRKSRIQGASKELIHYFNPPGVSAPLCGAHDVTSTKWLREKHGKHIDDEDFVVEAFLDNFEVIVACIWSGSNTEMKKHVLSTTFTSIGEHTIPYLYEISRHLASSEESLLRSKYENSANCKEWFRESRDFAYCRERLQECEDFAIYKEGLKPVLLGYFRFEDKVWIELLSK